MSPLKNAFVEFWKSKGMRGARRHILDMLRDPAKRKGLRPPQVHPSFGKLTCDAKTRRGTPCQCTEIWPNGRCKLHGGMCTGPYPKIQEPMTHERARKEGGQP